MCVHARPVRDLATVPMASNACVRCGRRRPLGTLGRAWARITTSATSLIEALAFDGVVFAVGRLLCASCERSCRRAYQTASAVSHARDNIINRRVRKYFGSVLHYGTVTSFDADAQLFRVDYDDDDWEEYDAQELETLLIRSTRDGPNMRTEPSTGQVEDDVLTPRGSEDGDGADDVLSPPVLLRKRPATSRTPATTEKSGAWRGGARRRVPSRRPFRVRQPAELGADLHAARAKCKGLEKENARLRAENARIRADEHLLGAVREAQEKIEAVVEDAYDDEVCKQAARALFVNLAAAVTRGFFIPGVIMFDYMCMVFRNVLVVRTSSWRWAASTLELASAIAATSGAALRLLSGTIKPNYGQDTAERLQTSNLIFPSTRSAPIAPPSSTSGLCIDTAAMRRILHEGKSIECLRVDGTIVGVSRATKPNGVPEGAVTIGYDAEAEHARYTETREKARELRRAHGCDSYARALQDAFKDDFVSWRTRIVTLIAEKETVIEKHERAGLKSQSAWAHRRGIVAEEKATLSRAREGLCDIERLERLMCSTSDADDDALLELFEDVHDMAYDIGIKLANELVLVVATDTSHTYDVVVARFSTSSHTKPDDVHDAVLEVKRVADSLQANNAKRVKMLSFDGEFTDAWRKHGIVIDALARSALDEVASTTSHAVLLKKANDAIAKLTSLEVKQLDELIAECLADGDHVLLPTQAQSSRTKHGVSATTRTVFETIGQSPPHGQQGCQKKPIRSMDEEMCVLRQVATHRDAHHKRLGEHVAMILFLVDGIIKTKGEIFRVGWCCDGSLQLHEDANHKLKNFVQAIRRQDEKDDSLLRAGLTKACTHLLGTLDEKAVDERSAIALAETVLNGKIDAQSTVLAETLMCNPTLLDEAARRGVPYASYLRAFARAHEAFVAPGLCAGTRRDRLLSFREEVIAFVGAARLAPQTWRRQRIRGIPRQIVKATWFNVVSGLHGIDCGWRMTAASTDAVEKLFGMLVSRAGFKPNIVLALQTLRGIEYRLERRSLKNSIVNEPANKARHEFSHRTGSATHVSGAWRGWQPPVDDVAELHAWYKGRAKTGTQHVSSAAKNTIRNNVHRRALPAIHDDDDD